MATWDYDYRAGPKDGTLTTLDTYCNRVRIIDEGMGAKRGSNIVVPYLEGTRPVTHKYLSESTLLLEVIPRYTNASGAVTHTDGAAGHVYENLSNVKRLLSGEGGLATLQRTAPDHGTVQIDVEVLTPVRISSTHFIFLFSLNCPTPFWRSTSQNSQNPSSPITPDGDGSIDDMWVELVGGTNASLTHTPSGATLTVDGTNPSGGVRILVGEGRAVRISGGADATDLITANRSYWMYMNGGVSNSFTVGGGTTATVKWYDHWRV